MAYLLGGLGFFGMGIILVVAAGTLAYSLFSEESPHHRYEREYTTPRIQYSPSFRNDYDTSTTRKRKKKSNDIPNVKDSDRHGYDSKAEPNRLEKKKSNDIPNVKDSDGHGCDSKAEPNRLEESGVCSVCRKDLNIDSKLDPCQRKECVLEPCERCIEQKKQKPYQLNTCLHKFHYECICNWFKNSLNSVKNFSNCPLCGCKFEPNDIIAIANRKAI